MSAEHRIHFSLVIDMDEMDGSADESAEIADDILRKAIESHFPEEDYTLEIVDCYELADYGLRGSPSASR